MRNNNSTGNLSNRSNNIQNNNINISNIDSNIIINVVCLGSSENYVKQNSEKLTSKNIDENGISSNIYDNIQLVVYSRWPNCSKTLPYSAVIDAIFIDIETPEEYNLIESYVKNKLKVHLILFVSNNKEIKQIASEYKNGKFLFKKDYNWEQLRMFMFEETLTFNQTIRNIFNTIDSNKNGFLEKKEVIAFARERGDNVSSQEFMDTLNLIDKHGLGKICFEDFEKWWKMGGHTNSVFGRLAQLSEMSRDMMIADEKFQRLKSDLKEVKIGKNDLASHLIKIYSEVKLENPGFQIFGNILAGGIEKDQALNIYMQRFSDDQEYVNQSKGRSWFQLVLTVEPNEAKKVVNTIRHLKASVLELLEKSNRATASFIRTFFDINERIIENQVLLTFNLKIDLEDFFENAVLPLLQSLSLLSCSEDSTSQFLFDLQTQYTLSEIFNNNLSVKEALKIYSLEIKANMLRGHLRKILKSMKFNNEINQLVWLVTSPNTADFNCTLDCENFFSENILNQKLGFIGEIIEYYINQYSTDIPFIRKITNVEFALKFNKLFIDMRTKLR